MQFLIEMMLLLSTLSLNNFQSPKETIGPIIAIEKAFAPRVVIPPWANNKAWNNNTIVPSTTVALGPNKIAARPTPVGCEQLPVTEGILRADNTNTKAPQRANNNFFFGCSFTIFVIFFSPTTKNGIKITHQVIAHFTGKKPSIICIASEITGVIININAAINDHLTLLFFILLSSPFFNNRVIILL